jgi:hypothetical protein
VVDAAASADAEAAVRADISAVLTDPRVAAVPVLVLAQARLPGDGAPLPSEAAVLAGLGVAPSRALARVVSAADAASCRAAFETFAARFGFSAN